MSVMTRGPRGPAGTTGMLLAAAVGAGLALLAGPGAPAADAATVAHLNPQGPGYYEWGAGQVALNITEPRETQTPNDFFGPLSITQTIFPDLAQIAADSDPGGPRVIAGDTDGPYVQALSFGTTIDSNSLLEDEGVSWVDFPGFPESRFDEGVPAFIGASVDLAGQTHYGWIGVVRTGSALDAFAWGYETEPGVPITAGAGIPSPGAAALLGLTGLAACQRRRRP